MLLKQSQPEGAPFYLSSYLSRLAATITLERVHGNTALCKKTKSRRRDWKAFDSRGYWEVSVHWRLPHSLLVSQGICPRSWGTTQSRPVRATSCLSTVHHAQPSPSSRPSTGGGASRTPCGALRATRPSWATSTPVRMIDTVLCPPHYRYVHIFLLFYRVSTDSHKTLKPNSIYVAATTTPEPNLQLTA